MTPTREQAELLPCPFCGRTGVQGMANVWCANCEGMADGCARCEEALRAMLLPDPKETK